MTSTTKRRASSNGKVPDPRAWPADEVRRFAIDDLLPSATNARTHSPQQVDELAAGIKRFGWTAPVLVDERNEIIAGHGRVLAAQLLGLETVPTVVARGWSDAEKRAYRLFDNKVALNAGWDLPKLAGELVALRDLNFDLGLTGFDGKEIQRLLFDVGGDALAGADDAQLPDVEDRAVSESGDVWELGPHRVVVGDCTSAATVERLMAGERVACVLADPPYGMGKEREGVANDNLYRERLDAFQLSWWRVAREHLAVNGSLYVWGNAPDLWRLWYCGGFDESGDLTVRNEIVWAKGSGFGMASGDMHSFSPESERCLFLMRGQQFLGNQNLDEYWEGWEPLRSWCVEQLKLAGLKKKDVNRLTESHMAGHWFGRSQFRPISREAYELLQREAGGRAFVESYDELFERLFPGIRDGGNAYVRELSERVRETRTHFDGSHDAMTDVWRFPRVAGEERFGHATPKPVAMMGRILRTSVPEGAAFYAPFLGTGPELVAAQLLGRRCYAAELEPRYVDVAVRRWEQLTGQNAVLMSGEAPGFAFAAVAEQRQKSTKATAGRDNVSRGGRHSRSVKKPSRGRILRAAQPARETT